MGFMTFWNVNLDSISMINLVIFIGFWFFCSHFLCIYFQFKTLSKLKSHWGIISARLPHVTKYSFSNNRGVCVLSAAKSYIFRTFFKIVSCYGIWSCSWPNFYYSILNLFWAWIATDKSKTDYGIPDCLTQPDKNALWRRVNKLKMKACFLGLEIPF